jgi:hypothetical protein
VHYFICFLNNRNSAKIKEIPLSTLQTNFSTTNEQINNFAEKGEKEKIENQM